MYTVYDYIKYYKNFTFEEIYLTDMDNIVFSILAYLPLEKIDFKDNDSLDFVCKNLANTVENKNTMAFKSKKVLEKIKNCKRYKDIKISNFTNIVDSETQFSALTIRIFDFCFVVFRGTDNSLIGWKEDIELGYRFPVNCQKHATNYLISTIKDSDQKIYVAGHSKGGNLAMTAVMETTDDIFKRIIKVYNNDGPGFLKPQYNSLQFKRMSKKLKMFVPEDSVVGILLSNVTNYEVVKSSSIGVHQHDLTSWNCFGQFLVTGSLSTISQKFQIQINGWVNSTDNSTKEKICDSLFRVISESGIKYFSELKKLKPEQIVSMINEAKSIDGETKQLLLQSLKMLRQKS